MAKRRRRGALRGRLISVKAACTEGNFSRNKLYSLLRHRKDDDGELMPPVIRSRKDGRRRLILAADVRRYHDLLPEVPLPPR